MVKEGGKGKKGKLIDWILKDKYRLVSFCMTRIDTIVIDKFGLV